MTDNPGAGVADGEGDISGKLDKFIRQEVILKNDIARLHIKKMKKKRPIKRIIFHKVGFKNFIKNIISNIRNYFNTQLLLCRWQ